VKTKEEITRNTTVNGLNEVLRRKTSKISIQFREVWKLKLTLKNNKETVFLKIILIKIAITLLKMDY
jgi:hypothetical protein